MILKFRDRCIRKFVNNQMCACYDAHMQNAKRKLIGIVTARAGEGSGIFRVPSYMGFDLAAHNFCSDCYFLMR